MYIGIDLGGTNIAAGIVSEQGEILFQRSIPTMRERKPSQVVEDISTLIEDLLKTSAIFGTAVHGIGVGIPGVASPVKGDVKICVNLGWQDIPFGSVLRKRFKLPVFVDNDATVAAAAEFIVGQHGRYKNAVMLTLGTGVGGGVMVDGKMISGHHGIAGEIGHMLVGDNFYCCNCGRNGCLETFSSSTALIKYVEHIISESDVKTVLTQNELSGKLILEAAQMGDPVALSAFHRMTNYLAKGLMNITCLFDPEVILIGGGLSMMGDFLINEIRKKYQELKYYPMLPAPSVEIAKLHNNAGIIGAAMLVKLFDFNNERGI